MEFANVTARPAHGTALGVTSTATAILHHKGLCDAVMAILSVTRIASLRCTLPASAVLFGRSLNGSHDFPRLCGRRITMHRHGSMRASSQIIESRFEGIREFLCRASAPVVQEEQDGPVPGHVVVNCDYVETILTERPQDRRNFVFEHGNVASDNRILLRPHKSGPCIEPHARIDSGSVFLNGKILTPHRNLVDRAGLFAFMPHDLGDLGRVQWRASTKSGWSSGGRWNMTD